MCANYAIKSLKDKIIHFFMVTNCLYLLSVCLLLLGAYLMMHSTILSTHPFVRYLEVYGILEIYEILLIIICILILRRLHVVEDGLILAGIEIFLFLDPTFFNNAFYTIDLSTGLIVNLSCLILMLIKYFVLIKFARIPSSQRMNYSLFTTAVFIYLYPVALTRSLEQINVDNFYYLFCWMPLILSIIIPRIDLAADKKSVKTDIKANHAKNFLFAVALITIYIVISHLVESAIGYNLTFWASYLSPLLIALCVLMVKLKPEWIKTVNGNQFIWIATISATILSVFQDQKFIYTTIFNFHFAPFRYIVAANILFNLYLWKKYSRKSYLVAAFVYGFFIVSGHSIESIILNIITLNLRPFLFLAILFTWLTLRTKNWKNMAITGILYLLAILGHFIMTEKNLSVFFFWQVASIWILFVLIKFNIDKKGFCRYSIITFLIFYAFIKSIGIEYKLVFTAYFYIIAIATFLVAFSRKYHFPKVITLFAFFVKIFYEGRAILQPVTKLPKYLSSGIIIIILAFIILILGYFVSSLKSKIRKN